MTARVLSAALFIALMTLVGCGTSAPITSQVASEKAPYPSYKPARNEILWDTYGVPHIYGTSPDAVFHGYGYAQAQSHGDEVLRLYGEARGKGAEYWGQSYENTAVWLIRNGVPERAKIWYDQQDPSFRAKLDAFASGINAYAAAHPEAISDEVEVVLPVSGVDVIAHAHRLMNFIYVASPTRVSGEGDMPLETETLPGDDGSNTWAVAPKKTAGGATMLLQNPHLPWGQGYFIYYEAHLVGPDFEIYGATQIGLPVVRFAFNQQMGISNTVNNMLGATTYELTLKDGGYLFDGEVKPFEAVQQSYKLRQPDGSLSVKSLNLRSSVHGPVFEAPDGKTVALRVAGLDRPAMLHQYFDMVTAPNHAAFTAAMQRLQVPTFNITYADRDGNIEYIFNGVAPKRRTGGRNFWQGLVPGDSSTYLWNDVHSYEELPRVTNPSTGFVQNSNDPPWFPTLPSPVDRSSYPAYLAADEPLSMRAQYALSAMAGAKDLSFDRFTKMKLSTRSLLADRALPDLLVAARADPDPEVQRAVSLLEQWDREFSSDSRAALLFSEWALLFAGPRYVETANFAVDWSARDPVSTPHGIGDPEKAVAMLRKAISETKRKYGALDRPFGEVSRFKIGDVDLPGDGEVGGLGPFRVITWGPLNKEGKRYPQHGETWVGLIEFTTPVRAVGLMSYGNSRQKGTRHYNDQLTMLADQRFRELWLRREQIEANTESVTKLTP